MTKKPLGLDPVVSRRAFGLMMLGAAGAAGLSGCVQAKPGEDGNGGEGESGSQNPDGVFHGAWPYTMPPSGHFNFTPGLTQAVDLSMYHQMIMCGGGVWDWAAEEWLLLLAESYEFTEAKFTYKLKSGLVWSDDTPITSKDVEMTFWLRWLMSQQEWPMIAGLKSLDEQTVEFELKNPSTVIERRIMKAPILPSASYGEFGEESKKLFEAGKAVDSKEANALREKVQEWRPEDHAKDTLSSGPFRWDFDSITDARITLVKNDKGLMADQVKFKTIQVYNGETNDITPLVLDGTIDYATHGFPVSTQKQWEESGYRTLKPAVYSGLAICFGATRHKELEDRRFRQAIAHAVDRAEAGVISLDKSAAVPENMSGMPGLLEEQWLDDDTKGKLNKYPLDLDKAASLLEDAGWKRSNNKWMKPDGKPAEYAITFPSDFADWPPAIQYYAEKLNDFGFKIELDGIESPNLTERNNTGKFDMIARSWGGGETHPHFAYSGAFITDNYPVAINQGGRGIDFDLQREVPGMGKVDIQKMVTESGQGLDEDAQRKLIQQLAVIFNTELPRLPVYERFGNNPAQEGPRVKAFPADDDKIWASGAYTDNPVMLSFYRGTIEPS